ncbi:MAG: hypothetical protein ABSC05_19110 [Candidatus Solibacter sp.]
MPKRPQPELDAETYAATFGIAFGLCVGALIWVGIFYVVYGIGG